MTNRVKIREMNTLSQDDRGLSAEFTIPRDQSKFIFITRKHNTLSGNVYHEGKNLATSPKILILLTGKVILSYRELDKNNIIKEEIVAPAIIEISPYIVHNVSALEDFTMLECNSSKDLEQDKIKQEV